MYTLFSSASHRYEYRRFFFIIIDLCESTFKTIIEFETTYFSISNNNPFIFSNFTTQDMIFYVNFFINRLNEDARRKEEESSADEKHFKSQLQHKFNN